MRGVSLSPLSFQSSDFTDFFQKAQQAGNVVSWAGDWNELGNANSAPRVVADLGKVNNYTPLLELQFFTQSTGVLLRPLNQTNRQTYEDNAVALVEKYKLKYLGIGIEVNTLYARSPADFDQFVQFYSDVYDAVKTASPDTRVFTIFQLEVMKGLNGGLFGGTNDPAAAQWELLEKFPKSDLIAFTTYPCLIYKDPSEIPADYYTDILSHTQKKVAFTEIGWYSQAEPRDWESNDSQQAEFVSRFRDLSRDLDPELTIWSFLYDQDIAVPFRSMGLFRRDGTPKPAWNAWLNENADPDLTPAPALIPLTASPAPSSASPNAAVTSVPAAIPLNDMTAQDRYKGEDGGLYGNGLNQPPRSHFDAAVRELARIKPLDAQGNYSPTGKIVLLSLGMSNTTQEFSVFKRLADASPEKSPALRIVDGAQGGQTASIWAAQDQPWQVLRQRLQASGVTPEQVQVIWLKQANAQPTRAFPLEARELQKQMAVIIRRVKEYYPNVRIAYLSSRIYAGYASTGLNPEPHAFESAFAVRWLIQDQINSDPGLNFNPVTGPVVSPLLLWGPYLWADGLNPGSGGLTWERSDFSPTDGTHPSDSGREKVARQLLDYFKTNDLARSWFLKSS